MAIPFPPRFCQRCGRPMPKLAPDPAPDRVLRCTVEACGWAWYRDPKVAVGVVVEDIEGRILLVKRNHEPRMGQWAFPSGFVDAGEVLEVAAAREVREETGIEASIDALLGAYSEVGETVIFIAYAGRVVSGAAVAGDEAIEVAWFAPDDLPPLAFAHDGDVVAAWQQYRHEAAALRGDGL